MNLSKAPAERLEGQATEAEIAAWKKQYELGIYALKGGGHIAYFQNPNLDHVNCAMSTAMGGQPMDMYKCCAELTIIGGSRKLIENHTLFLGIATPIKRKMDGETMELVNL